MANSYYQEPGGMPQSMPARSAPIFSRPSAVYMNNNGGMQDNLNQSGGKKRRTVKKVSPAIKYKMYTGKRGGQYYNRKGRKIYV